MNPHIPVVLKRSGTEAPRTRVYYEVAANGVFQVRETDCYRAVTRTPEEIPGLLRQEQSVELRIPRVPAALLEEVVAFFRDVYRQHGGEAIVVLFLCPETGEWRADAPPQTLPGYRDWRGRWRPYLELQYGSVERPEGFLRFGSIHSHAHLAAYASHADCEDEQFEDGLHAVFGHLDSQVPSRAASFVANGVRFRLDPGQVLEPCATPGPDRPARAARADWLARVKRSEPYASQGPSGGPRGNGAA